MFAVGAIAILIARTQRRCLRKISIFTTEGVIVSCELIHTETFLYRWGIDNWLIGKLPRFILAYPLEKVNFP